MNKSPAFQFYPKQWLGDDMVMLMDWDARAMHMHFMCIAWQQHEPCTLPNDDGDLKKWVGSPPEWERLKKQIFRAWKLNEKGDRWIQEGLLREYTKQKDYAESRKKNAEKRWGKSDAHAKDMQCIGDALLLQSSPSVSSSKEKDNPPPSPQPPAAETFIELPLNDKTEYPITEAVVAELTALFPAVDVRLEFRSMKAWCLSNPANLKTRTGIKRFYTAWLSREQNRARKAQPPAVEPTPPAPAVETEEEKAAQERYAAFIAAHREEIERWKRFITEPGPNGEEPLNGVIPQSAFSAFIDPLIPVGRKKGMLTLYAPNGNAAWVEDHYRARITEYVSERTHGEITAVKITSDMGV